MMTGVRLFLAQFRRFWRLRASLSDLRLAFFRYRFALRSWAGNEADSSTAVLHIAKLTLLDLAIASTLVLLLWRLNPVLDPLAFAVSDSAYVELLGTIAAIGGVFIGLYYAALTAAMTAVYAQMPNTVRQLLMQERYGNAYMRFVATVTFLSLGLLVLQTIGISTSAAAAPVLAVSSGIAVFGFVKLGAWAFRLFDPTAISHAVFRELYLLLKQVAAGGYQWRSPAFQHFAQRRGAHALRTLEELAAVCEASEHLRDEAFVRLAVAALGFAEHSVTARERIPSDSGWFPQKYAQPEWYRASDHETSIAHFTGTLLQPKANRDHWWIEHRCEQIGVRALNSLLKRRQDPLARSVLSEFESYTGTLARHGWTAEALAVTDRLEDVIVPAALGLGDTEPSQIVNRVALIDYTGRLRVTCLLRAAEWADALDRQRLERALDEADWIDPRTPYSFRLHGYGLERAEWLFERLGFERMILGRSVTPRWYCAELFAQQDAEALSRAVVGLFRDAFQRMRTVLDDLTKKAAPWEKACLLSDALHYTRKAQRHWSRFKEAWDRTSADRLIPKLPWPGPDFRTIEDAITLAHVDVIERMAALLPTLPKRPEELPDYPGQFLHTSTEQVFELIIAGDSQNLAKIFPAVFVGCLATHDALRPADIKLDNPWLDAELSLAFAPILDLVELSGYSYLLSEVYPDRQTWPVVRHAWDTFLSAQPAFSSILASMIGFSKGLFAITPRAVLRTNWEQRIERVLRQLPTKPVGRGWGTRDAVDHPSVFVRTVAIPGLISTMYDGTDMFVAAYLMARGDVDRKVVHRQAVELSRSLAVTSRAGVSREHDEKEQDD